MRLTRTFQAALAAFLVLSNVSGVSAADASRTTPSCADLASVRLPHTVVTGTSVVPGTASAPAHCAVQLVVTNPPANDQIKVGVWLPDRWNGRYLGLGGGGFAGGFPAATPVAALRDGYAVASTDAGHADPSGGFALNPDGTLNWQLIADFGYVGIHRMTVTAKALVTAFYRTTSFRSYFNGCSTGGRQGLMEAQRYPDDYDGIAAGSPAINWTKLHPAQLWGQLQMRLAGNAVPRCKLAAATQAAVTACDARDKVKDTVIDDWKGCRFDARTLIGTETPCGAFTDSDVELINKMWAGPRDGDGAFLWYGPERGAPLEALNNTADGTGTPSPITLDWMRYFLLQNPGWDWRSMTYDQYLLLYQQSVLQYQAVIATDDPDLSAFRDTGGKIVLWHGTADPLIFFRGTVDYYRRVQAATGGQERAQEFARFFVAPGVGHCGGGTGAAPADALDAVVTWVEHGRRPDRLTGRRIGPAGDVVLTRPVCPYPKVARYDGRGPTTEAGSFTCADGFPI